MWMHGMCAVSEELALWLGMAAILFRMSLAYTGTVATASSVPAGATGVQHRYIRALCPACHAGNDGTYHVC